MDQCVDILSPIRFFALLFFWFALSNDQIINSDVLLIQSVILLPIGRYGVLLNFKNFKYGTLFLLYVTAQICTQKLASAVVFAVWCLVGTAIEYRAK